MNSNRDASGRKNASAHRFSEAWAKSQKFPKLGVDGAKTNLAGVHRRLRRALLKVAGKFRIRNLWMSFHS